MGYVIGIRESMDEHILEIKVYCVRCVMKKLNTTATRACEELEITGKDRDDIIRVLYGNQWEA